MLTHQRYGINVPSDLLFMCACFTRLYSVVGAAAIASPTSLLMTSTHMAKTSRVGELSICAGDTRRDGRCHHDDTHRVCAKIGDNGTSFWRLTGQKNWCGTDPEGDGKIACPEENPTWCICKWAAATWIQGQGCDESITFDCAATDVCDLKSSYTDFNNVDLEPAHDCMKIKCKTEWDACPETPRPAVNNTEFEGMNLTTPEPA